MHTYRTVVSLVHSTIVGAGACALPWIAAPTHAAATHAASTATQGQHRSADEWRTLGAAALRLHHFDAAIAAFQHSLTLQPDSPRVFYGLAVAYAGRHESARAFGWLDRTGATHRYDMTEGSEEPYFAAMRADPRFIKLLPAPADFEHPFVEDVKILREWRGESSGDQFGWIARKVGDVDGDGVTDIVVSAPTHGEKGSKVGRVYVYSVGSGRLLWKADGRPGDELGTRVEGVGDTDGDGIGDVAASVPAGSGVPHSIRGGMDGFCARSAHSGPTNCSEIIFRGAWQYSQVAESAGRAYLYSGKDGRLLRTFTCRGC